MENVGLRLRRLRERDGLSQRALAQKSGVSNAAISLIENNRSNPSLGLLKKILDTFSVSISDFLADNVESPGKVFFRSDELTEIGRGSISYREVGFGLGQKTLQILYEQYQPGADTGHTLLEHNAEEGGVILSGHLEVTVADETRNLGPGDAYLFDSRLPHRFRNTGDEACVVVSACTPPSF